MSFPVKHVIGAAIVEKFLTNMWWYPATPRNPLACQRLSMSCGYSASPAILAGLTVTPSLDILAPRKSICSCMKIDLESLRWILCFVSRLKRKWIILIWRSMSLRRVPSLKSSM